MRSNFLLPLFGLLAYSALHANNIQVSNTTLVDNTGSTVKVQFDISWENSWRGGGVINWDAAWIFVKYKQGQGTWQHVYVNPSGHSAPAGSLIEEGLLTPGSAHHVSTNPVVGVFLRRDAEGSGTFTANGVQLVWDYSGLGISYNDISQVQVFAIEMVYVNEGAYMLGSAGTEDNHFKTGSTNAPYPVTSEDAITISSTNLWATGNVEAAPLPASFPKGFRAFYCMKYEMSQQQYTDFLNTLTRTQQAARIESPIGNTDSSTPFTYVMSGTSSLMRTNYVRCPSSFAANLPLTFSTIAPYRAMNFISREDLFAYLDWCALRPFTELEFEKSCRGPLVPVEDAYAWGDASLAQGYYTVAAYIQSDETISSGYSTTAGNAVCTVTLDLNGGSGPLRTGIFAGHPLNTSRRSSGASYYGAMELSGNASEVSIAVSNADGRAYDGSHGDGSLDPGGLYTDPAWPESSLARGGSMGSSSTLPLTVSHRPLALSGGRGYMTGGRGVRTAP